MVIFHTSSHASLPEGFYLMNRPNMTTQRWPSCWAQVFSHWALADGFVTTLDTAWRFLATQNATTYMDHIMHITHILYIYIYMVSFLNLYGHPGVGQNILTKFEIFSKIPYSLQDDYRICPNTWCQDGCPADPSRWFVEPWTYYPYHKAQVQVCT